MYINGYNLKSSFKPENTLKNQDFFRKSANITLNGILLFGKNVFLIFKGSPRLDQDRKSDLCFSTGPLDKLEFNDWSQVRTLFSCGEISIFCPAITPKPNKPLNYMDPSYKRRIYLLIIISYLTYSVLLNNFLPVRLWHILLIISSPTVSQDTQTVGNFVNNWKD